MLPIFWESDGLHSLLALPGVFSSSKFRDGSVVILNAIVYRLNIPSKELHWGPIIYFLK